MSISHASENILPFRTTKEQKVQEIYDEFSRVYRTVSPEVQRYASRFLAIAARAGVEGEQLSKELWEHRDIIENDREPYEKTDKAEVGRLARVLAKLDWNIAEEILALQADKALGITRETGGLLDLKTNQDLLNLPPMNWVIEGILPEKSLVVMYGPPKQYKSFIVQAMAWSISHGCNWLGHPTEEGAVFYIAGEGEWGMSKRYRAWLQKHSLPTNAFFPFYSYGRSINLANEMEADALIQSVPEGTKLIVIDTLNRCMEGDENSAADMRAFVSGCDRVKEETGATVLIVHHSGKDTAKGMRGSSALLGAVDVAISVEKDKDNDEFVTIKNPDMKDYEEFPPITLRGEEIELEDGDTSLVFGITEYRTTDRKPKPMPPAQTKILNALQTADGPVRPKNIPLLADISRASWDKHRPKLLEQGKIRREGEGYIIVNNE
ncbi:MAG: helicase RepA family protein [Firmicutes bacterium]|nr:helicase RepA family protein [Bacillota bacterium]